MLKLFYFGFYYDVADRYLDAVMELQDSWTTALFYLQEGKLDKNVATMLEFIHSNNIHFVVLMCRQASATAILHQVSEWRVARRIATNWNANCMNHR